jgi:2',3'-cyclic-nucleotide 2'-phosphodiesterase (5'-nucleotidase family)
MRVLNFKLFVLFVTILSLASCAFSELKLNEIAVSKLPVTDTVIKNDAVENFIAPYRDHINEVLDKPLSYSPETLSKQSGSLNTKIGNLMADIVREETNYFLEKKGMSEVDMSLLNFGGIRSGITAGHVSERTAYEVMPFENTIVVVTLSGKPLTDMIDYLVREKVAHPFSGLMIILNPDGSLKEAYINERPIDFSKTYRVATSNFLYGGGDGMDFFKAGTNLLETGYLIRNAMTDYFRKTDTLKAKIDNRFFQTSLK